jgi:hypothetical protein
MRSPTPGVTGATYRGVSAVKGEVNSKSVGVVVAGDQVLAVSVEARTDTRSAFVVVCSESVMGSADGAGAG